MKLVLKGIVTREDAALAAENGVDAVIVSNHGGRSEESGRAAIDSLPEVVEAVAGRLPVLVDSGFRRGTDVFKALALGARAVGIGRPYLWGLAAFGQEGVEVVLRLLRAELETVMRTCGTPSLRDITTRLGGRLALSRHSELVRSGRSSGRWRVELLPVDRSVTRMRAEGSNGQASGRGLRGQRLHHALPRAVVAGGARRRRAGHLEPESAPTPRTRRLWPAGCGWGRRRPTPRSPRW